MRLAIKPGVSLLTVVIFPSCLAIPRVASKVSGDVWHPGIISTNFITGTELIKLGYQDS